MIDTFDLSHYLEIFIKQKFAMFLIPLNQKIQNSKQLFKLFIRMQSSLKSSSLDMKFQNCDHTNGGHNLTPVLLQLLLTGLYRNWQSVKHQIDTNNAIGPTRYN